MKPIKILALGIMGLVLFIFSLVLILGETATTEKDIAIWTITFILSKTLGVILLIISIRTARVMVKAIT